MGFCRVQQSRTVCTTPHQPLQAGPSSPLLTLIQFLWQQTEQREHEYNRLVPGSRLVVRADVWGRI